MKHSTLHSMRGCRPRGSRREEAWTAAWDNG